MRQWRSAPVEDIRLGNVVSIDGVTDEVTGKRPSGREGSTAVFLVLRDHAPIEINRDAVVDVYR